MGKFSEFLNRKVFGIKYLYLVAIFVLILVGFAWKMKAAPGVSPDETTDDTTDDGTGTDGLYDPNGDALAPTAYPDTDGTGTVTQGGSGGTTTDPVYTQPQEPDDNNDWARKAISWLITQGSAPDIATGAIQKYLGGDQLSWDEGALRDKAIRQFGLPPEIPSAGGTASKPTTPTTPHTTTPAVQKPPLVYTIVAGGPRSYTGVAKKFYGSDAARYIDLLQSKNTNLGHSSPNGGWKNGTKIFVPLKTEPKYYTAKKGKTTLAQIAGANGISQNALKELNDTTKFPVAVGKKVRVA